MGLGLIYAMLGNGWTTVVLLAFIACGVILAGATTKEEGSPR